MPVLLAKDVLLILLVLVELVLDCSILVLLVLAKRLLNLCILVCLLAKNICTEGANVLLDLSILVCLTLQESADKANLQSKSTPSVLGSDLSNAICTLCRTNGAALAAFIILSITAWHSHAAAVKGRDKGLAIVLIQIASDLGQECPKDQQASAYCASTRYFSDSGKGKQCTCLVTDRTLCLVSHVL